MTDSSAIPGAANRLWSRLASAALSLCWLGSVQVLWRCYVEGGQKWLQGDWLINLAAGPVRRGPLGETLLRLADLGGIAPLTLVLGLQLALATVLFAVSGWLIWRRCQPALVPLVLSAGFFAVLWTADPMAGFRKEILPLAGIALVALPGGGTARLILTAGLMVAGAWGHEIGVLMLPAWGIALYLLPPAVSRGMLRAVVGVTFALGALAAIYALRHPALADAGPVCAAIRLRQSLGPQFCTGAIAWLADAGNGPHAVRVALANSVNVQLLPLSIAAAFAPLAGLCWHLRQDRGRLVLLAVAITPLCLLYPVALDWGRWVSAQVTVASLMLMGLDAAGRLPALRPPRAVTCLLWLIVGVSAGLTTMTEVVPNALLRRILFGFAI